VVAFWLETLMIALAGSVAVLGVFSVARTGKAEPKLSEEDDSDPDDIEADREFEFDGRHLLASYSACDSKAIRDIARLTAAFHAAVHASGATLLHSVEHTFPPDGMTAVAVLSESHASIHTYPEHLSCFVDIFTCGTTCNVEAFDASLRSFLRPKKHSRRIIRRHEGMVDESPSAADGARSH
jgi:S-adenosylmethionine decarboxylase